MTLEDFLFKGPTPVQNSLRDAEMLQAKADNIERQLQVISNDAEEATGYGIQEAHLFWARVLENDKKRNDQVSDS